ncbi:hypothetical protein AN964_07715 [Heyndrickxia shackletonii]|uniref:Uncharacterized protein n=1 Tax=Heyndrickxia shackletonii TaxID=157838 RepID=A0A0Q3THE0_9BACI|nr:hypothetical protein [Heyndrickxia shackletonii]KQL53390.1 hypothetical protein AN964_07715 [Heyndrickxia shackletonii]NEY99957.1 hypothetical protein [Heyndrickxia shackletonii]
MLKKNQGHVLIIVLLIFTISFILITALFSLSVNTRKQINISDIEMQKTNAAEMGINLFEKYLLKVIQTKNYKNVNELLQQLKDQLNPLIKSRTIDNNLSYNINKIDISSTLDSQKNTIITLVVSTQGIFKDSVKTLNKTYKLTVPNGTGESGGNSEGIFTSKSQFDSISDSNRNFPSLSPVLSGKIPNQCTSNLSNCNLNTDVYFNQSLSLTGNYTVNGNAQFNDVTMNNNSKITISKDAIFTKAVFFNPDSEINIGGNALFNESLGFKATGPKLTISGDSKFNKAVLPQGSQLTLLGNTTFGNSLELNESNLTLGKNVYFSKNVRLSTNSTIKIYGSADFTGDINVDNGSSITINGNFYSPSKYITVNGTICVYGSSDVGENGGSTTNAQIIRNVGSCGNAPATIYILNKPIQSNDNTGDLNINIDSLPVKYQ